MTDKEGVMGRPEDMPEGLGASATDLKQRLRAKEHGPDFTRTDARAMRLILRNPDGPEAAATIERMAATIEELREGLRKLLRERGGLQMSSDYYRTPAEESAIDLLSQGDDK